jgi:putative transposase
VFEEAAVDLSRALAAFGQSKSETGVERRAGFPKTERKGRCRDSFRLRNKAHSNGRHCIRVGQSHPRSVTLPTIGTIRVHDDTRRLRRLLRPLQPADSTADTWSSALRARILSATVARHGDRWHVCLNVEAPDFHPGRRHPPPLERLIAGLASIEALPCSPSQPLPTV